MAPQHSIPMSANVLGTVGTVLWSIQLIPQIWYNWKHKETDGLPTTTMFLWAVCAVPFGVYAIVQNFNIPLQIQPQIFGTLSLVCWAQSLIYHNRWKVGKASVTAVGTAAMFAASQTILVLTLRGPYNRGVSWPMTFIGVIAAVLLALGLIPPWVEIWKRRGQVIGISFIFLTIDWFGAFFSLMALVAQNSFDILGGVLYIVCLLLEAGIFISQWIWLFRTRQVRKEAKLQGQSLHEYLAERDLEKSRRHIDFQSEHSLDTRDDQKSGDFQLNDSVTSFGHHKSLERMPVPPSRVVYNRRDTNDGM